MDNDRDQFASAVEQLGRYLALEQQCGPDADEWNDLAAGNGPYPLPTGGGVQGMFKRLQVGLANRLLWRQHAFNAQLVRQVRLMLAPQPARAKPRLLFLVPYDVVRPRVGGAVRIHALARALAAHCRVELLTITGPLKEPARIPVAQDLDIISLPVSRALQGRIESARARWGRASWLMTLLENADQVPYLATYLERARFETTAVVLSGPYLAPLVAQCLPGIPRIYETHDVSAEFVRHLADGHEAAAVLKRVGAEERKALADAVMAVCVSEEDRAVFEREYDAAQDKMLVVPNGVDTARSAWMPPGQARALRRTWWQDRPVVLFMGSVLAANMEAMNFIRTELAPKLPRPLFAVMGVSHREFAAFAGASSLPANVLFTGQVSARVKEGVMALADLAIAPMRSGTGTSLKIPDYLAHGKPVVTTELGARGHEELRPHLAVAPLEHFAERLREMLDRLEMNPGALDEASLCARREVERRMDWSVLCAPLLKRVEQMLSS